VAVVVAVLVVLEIKTLAVPAVVLLCLVARQNHHLSQVLLLIMPVVVVVAFNIIQVQVLIRIIPAVVEVVPAKAEEEQIMDHQQQRARLIVDLVGVAAEQVVPQEMVPQVEVA
jgi:Zn-dependent protease with chaperone function